jgi:hypothetical protein
MCHHRTLPSQRNSQFPMDAALDDESIDADESNERTANWDERSKVKSFLTADCADDADFRGI